MASELVVHHCTLRSIVSTVLARKEGESKAVELLQRCVADASAVRALRRKVGMVFQFHCLFEHLSALQNVALALVHVQHLPAREAEQRSRDLLATLGAGFGYWPTASGRKKALAAAAMIGAVVLGVMVDSRSPFVATAIGCAVYVVWKYRVRGVIGIAALFAIVYTATFAIPSMRDYVNRGDLTSFTGR